MSADVKPLDVDIVADVALTHPVTVYAHDPLAVTKNAATNSRLFCAMIAAAGIAGGHPSIAVWAAIPIGTASLIDILPGFSLKWLVSFANMAFAAFVAIVSLNLLW